MPLFQNIAQAVALVTISFLVKKYFELKFQHNKLKAEYEELSLTCKIMEKSHSTAVCSCACKDSFPTPVAHYQTLDASLADFTQVNIPLDPSSSYHNEISEDNFSPTKVYLGDYGQTLDPEAAEGRSELQPKASTDSTTIFNEKVELPSFSLAVSASELPVNPLLTVSTPVSYLTQLRDATGVSQIVTGKTEWKGQQGETLVMVDSTMESVENIQPLPSTEIGHKHTARIDKMFNDEMFSSSTESVSDFYLGSRSDAEENLVELQVIFTEPGDYKSSNDEKEILMGINKPDLSLQQEAEDYFSSDEGDLESTAEVEDDHDPDIQIPLQWANDSTVEKLSIEGTSAECLGETISSRRCHFHNLCFETSSRNFVFLHSLQSRFVNVPSHDKNPYLLEMSTVRGHNAHYFSYVDIPAERVKQFQVAVVHGVSIIFKRFKPDNIMHVFHDDIIALHNTIHSLDIQKNSEGLFKAVLFLADENSFGEFFTMYQIFTTEGAFTTRSLLSKISSGMVCFEEAHVGLSKDTAWYQYGFFEPQGPITDAKITSTHVRSVSSYILKHFAKPCTVCGMGAYLVLILRKENRLILNEMELILAISKEFKVKVMTVSFETHELADMIPIIHHSQGIVSMHGSLLILAMFLPQGSIVVELFPYAVNPTKYIPYRTLCQIPGMNITYRAWVNTDPHNSVAHPDWPPEQGGIQHLPILQQQEIPSQTEVPGHLCCEDPSWLYHIFQDTRVNVPEVLALIHSALEESERLKADISQKLPVGGKVLLVNTEHFAEGQQIPQKNVPELPEDGWYLPENGADLSDGKDIQRENSQMLSPGLSFVPGPVQNVVCKPHCNSLQPTFTLQWNPPWNLEFNKVNNVVYYILLQNSSSEEYFKLNVGNTNLHVLSKGVKPGINYWVWIYCVADDTQGPFSDMVTCICR